MALIMTSFFINNGPFTLQQVAEICEAELKNTEKANVTVNNINTLEKATAGEICFFYDKTVHFGRKLQFHLFQIFIVQYGNSIQYHNRFIAFKSQK